MTLSIFKVTVMPVLPAPPKTVIVSELVRMGVARTINYYSDADDAKLKVY